MHEYTRSFDAQLPGAPGSPNKGGRAIPRFTETFELDEQATNEKGYAVMNERIVCEIFIPGDHLSTATCYVNPDDPYDPTIQRFPEEWGRFAKTRENERDPNKWAISDWPYLNRAQVELLRSKHVFYVEDLAELTDQQLADTVGIGGQRLRKQAKAAIETAKTGAVAAKMVQDLEDRDAKISMLEKQLDAVTAQMQALATATQKTDALAKADAAIESVTIEAEAAQSTKIHVPHNYTSFPFQKLKKLANEITGGTVPVNTSAEAKEIINEYLAIE